MLSKITNYIRDKIDYKMTPSQKKKMDNFAKTRERLITVMIRKKLITESRIKMHAIFITFFGCGKLRHGPGTLASFAALVLWFVGSAIFSNFKNITSICEMVFWLSFCAALFVYGMIFIPLYEKYLNSHDHPSIVIDEVVGQIVALCLTYPFVKQYYFDNSLLLSQLIMIGHLILSFTLFRFLDITKPFFIGWVDRNVTGSFGVMLDDLICGLVAAAINILIFGIYTHTVTKLHGLI